MMGVSEDALLNVPNVVRVWWRKPLWTPCTPLFSIKAMSGFSQEGNPHVLATFQGDTRTPLPLCSADLLPCRCFSPFMERGNMCI